MTGTTDLRITEIDDARLDHLIAVWEDSRWFPPFYETDAPEVKRQNVRQWLAGERTLIKARFNIKQ